MLLSRTMKFLRAIYEKRREEETMRDNQDFFSPAYMDEHLDLPAHTSGNDSLTRRKLTSTACWFTTCARCIVPRERACALIAERLGASGGTEHAQAAHCFSFLSRGASAYTQASCRSRFCQNAAQESAKSRFRCPRGPAFPGNYVGSMLAIVHFTRLHCQPC